jgi:hypothetical protein
MTMVEVFKTNVKDPEQAVRVLERIHATFPGYSANFDLDDCDKILRVISRGVISIPDLVELIKRSGFDAQVLADEQPVNEILHF